MTCKLGTCTYCLSLTYQLRKTGREPRQMNSPSLEVAANLKWRSHQRCHCGSHTFHTWSESVASRRIFWIKVFKLGFWSHGLDLAFRGSSNSKSLPSKSWETRERPATSQSCSHAKSRGGNERLEPGSPSYFSTALKWMRRIVNSSNSYLAPYQSWGNFWISKGCGKATYASNTTLRSWKSTCCQGCPSGTLYGPLALEAKLSMMLRTQ